MLYQARPARSKRHSILKSSMKPEPNQNSEIIPVIQEDARGDSLTIPSSLSHDTKSSAGITLKKSIAIAIVLLIVIGGSAIVLGRNKLKPVDWVRINATEKQNVTLPDGSTILLRKGSALDYPSDFGIKNRQVNLSGEAFIEVFYNPSIPFTVKTLNGLTTNFGNNFLIRSHDSVDQVYVQDGRVKMESYRNGGQVFINSGEKAELINNKIVNTPIGTDNYLGWKVNKLIYNNTPLIQVAREISEYYGIPVHFTNEMNPGQVFVTTQFDNQNLLEVLRVLQSKTGFIFQLENAIVTVSKPLIIIQPEVAKKPVEAEKVKVQQKYEVATPVIKKKKKKRWNLKFWGK